MPTTPLGRAFTDALGAANRAVADACDAVVLVVAGQPVWLKPAAVAAAPPAAPPPSPRRPASRGHGVGRHRRPSPEPTPSPTPERAAARRARPTRRRPAPTPGARQPPGPRRPWRCRWSPPGWSSSPAWNCRCPTSTPARRRSTGWPRWTYPAPGWACWTGWSASPPPPRAPRRPRPWGSVRVLLLHGDHAGGRVGRRRRPASRPAGPRRPAPAGARWPGWPPRAAPASRWWTRRPSAPIEDGPALTADAGGVGAALRLAAGRAGRRRGRTTAGAGGVRRRHRGGGRGGARGDRGRGAAGGARPGDHRRRARSTTRPG